MTFNDRALKVADAISTQRHLAAIRNGFFPLMPLIITASFFVLINNVFLNLPFFQNMEIIPTIKNVGDAVFRGSLGILALLSAFYTAYFLAVSYKKDGLLFGAVSIGCFVATLPGVQQINGADAWGILTFGDTSATGLFVAIIIALASGELLNFLTNINALKISMPESVPPAVAKSFNTLIPIFFTFTIFGIISIFFIVFFGKPLNALIAEGIQAPLVNLIQQPLGFLGILFLQNFFWFLGIHGAFVLGPITEPTYLAALQENITLVQQGSEATHIITKTFMDSFAFMGGGGNTIGLVIALLIFSKRQDSQSIGKLALLPGLFNINEPLIFGLPVVLNPFYGIPLILVPIINASIAYFATSIGLISKTFIQIPWTTPPILGAYLGTGGDWRAAILAALLLILSIFVYAPFVIFLNSIPEK